MKLGKIAAVAILTLSFTTNLACSNKESYKTEDLKREANKVVVLDKENIKKENNNIKDSEVVPAKSPKEVKNTNKDRNKKSDYSNNIKNKKEEVNTKSKDNTKNNMQNSIKNQNRKNEEIQIKPKLQITYKDGVYIGSSEGKNGEIKVQVIVKDGRIYNIEVLSHNDTQNLFDIVYKKIINAVYEKQSAEVEIVSGATLSSKGLIEAIGNALREAKN